MLKIAKFFAWLMGGAIGIPVLFYLVLLLINWRDAPPSEAAKHFSEIHAQRPTVADEKNGYVYLVGISVAPRFEPMEAGLAMVKRVRESESETYAHPDFPEGSFAKAFDKKFVELREACHSPGEKCIAFLENNNSLALDNDSASEIFLKRYREMLNYQLWQDIYPRGLESPIPRYAAAVDGQLLLMRDIIQHDAIRTPEESIDLLNQDARFWRNVLVSSDGLISSMVAVSSLKRNLFWTNFILKRLPARKGGHEPPSAWISPINSNNRTMERVWAGEMAMVDHSLRNSFKPDLYETITENYGEASLLQRLIDGLAMPLFLRQETINHIAEERLALIDSLNVPYEKLPLVISQLNSDFSEDDHGINFPDILYNPAGRAVVSLHPANDAIYTIKVAELEGGRRALLATLQLRKDNIPREKVAEALSASPHRNPYTNQPFAWDETSQSIVFEGLDTEKGKRYSFSY